MKSKLLIFYILIFSTIYSQSFEKPFKFSVYDYNQAGDIFNLLSIFAEIEESEDLDKEYLLYLLENGLSSSNVLGLFSQAYFRETQNEKVKEFIQVYLEDFDDEIIKETILLRHNSQRKTIKNAQVETFQLNNGNFYDENIQFSDFTPISLFKNKLNIYIPRSDWIPMQWTDESGETDNNSITFMSGGQTTACNVKVERHFLSSIPKIGSIDSPENMIYELTEKSVVTQNNADLTVLRIEHSLDSLFIFSLDLYDFDEREKYEISYYYNISTINMNYKIYENLKKHLLYTSFLAYFTK